MSDTGRTGVQPAATGRHLAQPKPKKPAGSTGRERAAAPPGAAPATSPKRRPRKRKRGIYLGILITAFVLLVAAAIMMRIATEKRRYDDYYAQALASYQSGDYDGALSDLRRAAALDETEDCLWLMADCYEAQGNYDRALELMRKLDLKDESVVRRIAELEAGRVLSLRAAQVTVNGQSYEPGTQSLTIRDKAVSEDLLQEVTQLYALSNLTLSGLGLRDISPLSALGGLTVLDLSGNSISDIRPLASLTQLRSLYLDGNPIADFSPLYGLSGLTTLSIRGIEIGEEALAALSAALPNCAIHSEDAVESVREITLGGSTFPADVSVLDLSNRGLTDISALSVCRELKRLDLTGNQISDLSPLIDLPGLEELIIKDNLITDLRPLMSLTELKRVNAEGNGVSSTVALGTLTALKELHLAGNPIRDFSGLARLSALETLGLEETGLTDADLEYLRGLGRLRLLTIYDNPELSGEAVDSLKSSLASCYIQHSPLVYSVTVAGVSVKRNVTELDMSGHAMTMLGNISVLTELETLRLQGCGLSSLEGVQLLTALKTLDLSHNDIRDPTPLLGLRRLESLDLTGNRLQSASYFKGMTWLRELRLGGNDIPAAEIEELRAALPDCTIVFD